MNTTEAPATIVGEVSATTLRVAGTGAPAIPGTAPKGVTQDTSTWRQRAGLYMTPDHGYHWNGGPRLPSVTTILDIVSKPALHEWFKWIVATLAVDQIHELARRLQDDGRDAAVEWLRGMPGYQRDTAARLGSGVHHLADMASRGQEIDAAAFGVPDGVLPYLDAYRRFLARYSASNIVSSEKAIINETVGYGGTYDMLLKVEGELWLVDLKTSKGLYPETALQLAAYAHGEWIALPGDPVKYAMPKVDAYAVLHLRPDAGYPDGYNLKLLDVTERDWRAFQSAHDLWSWRQEGRHR